MSVARPAQVEPEWAVRELESVFGVAVQDQLTDPMDELVSCILSQHTSDLNRDRGFDSLKQRFIDWASVEAAGPTGIEPVIRMAGLSNQKSKTIFRCLKSIREQEATYSLEFLRAMPPLQARKWLENLPGVGPKTASIVLCFSFGMPLIPVDTHVDRVSKRLGLVGSKTSADKAHDVLLSLVPEGLAYRFHVAVIRHGRAICKAARPRCAECVLRQRCPSAGL